MAGDSGKSAAFSESIWPIAACCAGHWRERLKANVETDSFASHAHLGARVPPPLARRREPPEDQGARGSGQGCCMPLLADPRSSICGPCTSTFRFPPLCPPHLLQLTVAPTPATGSAASPLLTRCDRNVPCGFCREKGTRCTYGSDRQPESAWATVKPEAVQRWAESVQLVHGIEGGVRLRPKKRDAAGRVEAFTRQTMVQRDPSPSRLLIALRHEGTLH